MHPKSYRHALLFLVGLILCLLVSLAPVTKAYESPESSSYQNFAASQQNLNDIKKIISQGAAAYSTGQYNLAITIWSKALNQNLEEQNKSVINSYLATAYRQVGKVSKAINHWGKVIDIHRTKKNKEAQYLLAVALTDQAQAYTSLGQFRPAFHQLEEALNIAQNQDNKNIEAVIWGAIGNAHSIAGNYKKAFDSYTNSLETAKQLNNSTYITTALNNQANTLLAQSKQFQSQASTSEQEGDINEQNRLLELAEEKKVAALMTAKSAIIESGKSNLITKIKSLVNVIGLMQTSSKSDRSEQIEVYEYYQQAIKLLKNLPDTRTKAFTLIDLTQKIKIVTAKEKINNLEWANEIAKKIDDINTQSFALGTLGSIYEQEKQFSTAMTLTHQAQLAAQQVSAGNSLYQWQWQAGRIYNASGQPAKAILSYEQAIHTLQSIRSDLVTANKELQLDIRDEVEPIYREAISLLLDNSKKYPDNIKKALDFADLLRLTELQNYFGDECLELQQALEKTEENLSKSNNAIIRTIILDKTTYVSLQLPDGSLKLYSIPLESQEIKNKIEEFRYLLEDITTKKYLKFSQEFYDLLIRPIEGELTNLKPNTLIFVNDGLFRNIPMAALHDGKQFLVEKYPIINNISNNLLRQSKFNKNKKALIFGLTVEVPPFNALQYVDFETRGVKNILGGIRFLNENFTLINMRNKIKQNFSMIHIATHSKFSGTYSSSFLQAFDDRISLEELEEILRDRKEPIELLTLSACQTAAGDNRATLGLAGLAVRTGVENVLASLWFINDRETVFLIENFYSQLLQPKITKAEALRKAQLMLIANPKSHPSIWSSFILVGQG